MILLWKWIKKSSFQVHLEECKYRIKKIQTPRFINAELESDSESESDTELMLKLKPSSASE